MENRLKLRICRMFRASFGSCRSRNISDVIGKPVFIAENRREFHLIEPLSPKIKTFPSICKPRWQESMEISGNDCIVTKEVLQRRKVSERNLFFISGVTDGRTCPPASPTTPLNPFYNDGKEKSKSKPKSKSKKIKKTQMKNKKKEGYQLSSSSLETNNGGWFSSEGEIEDEADTFCSSKSFSSDSWESHRRNKKISRRRRAVKNNSEMSMGSHVETKGKVQESFAVVKRSSDPYSDFRTSMVEMIIEKQIFAAKDLEQLLQCFLSLNSSHHHKVIVEVFSEIWETLFS